MSEARRYIVDIQEGPDGTATLKITGVGRGVRLIETRFTADQIEDFISARSRGNV